MKRTGEGKSQLRRSRIDCATGPGCYDGIFSEHVEREGEAQRQTKKDISQPASLPPVLDVKNPGGRQSGWKKRFVELKSKHAICLRGKRTSMRFYVHVLRCNRISPLFNNGKQA